MCFLCYLQEFIVYLYLIQTNVEINNYTLIILFLLWDEWMLGVDDEARTILMAAGAAGTQNEVDTYNSLKNTQDVVLKDGFFLKYK